MVKDLNNERWVDVSGYEGLYQVSNKSRVKSLSRQKRHPSGVFGVTKEKLLSQSNTVGYLRVGLKKGKRQLSVKVHRLIAIAFIPNPLNKPQINHKNGIRIDNRIENLEWCSAKENTNHAINVLGKSRNGEKSHYAKVTNADAIHIKELYQSGYFKQKEIALMYKLKISGVSKIITGRTWKHLNII